MEKDPNFANNKDTLKDIDNVMNKDFVDETKAEKIVDGAVCHNGANRAI